MITIKFNNGNEEKFDFEFNKMRIDGSTIWIGEVFDELEHFKLSLIKEIIINDIYPNVEDKNRK
jgi:hypothetical protein